MYELVWKLQPEYAVSKSYYIAAPTEGAYTTLKDKKTKVVNILYLYFVYEAKLLKVQNHPITQMDKLFQVPEGLGVNKCLYDEAKYTNYPADDEDVDEERGLHLQRLWGLKTYRCCHDK